MANTLPSESSPHPPTISFEIALPKQRLFYYKINYKHLLCVYEGLYHVIETPTSKRRKKTDMKGPSVYRST